MIRYILHYITVHYIIHYITLHYITLYYIASHCLHCFILYYTTNRRVATLAPLRNTNRAEDTCEM